MSEGPHTTPNPNQAGNPLGPDEKVKLVADAIGRDEYVSLADGWPVCAGIREHAINTGSYAFEDSDGNITPLDTASARTVLRRFVTERKEFSEAGDPAGLAIDETRARQLDHYLLSATGADQYHSSGHGGLSAEDFANRVFEWGGTPMPGTMASETLNSVLSLGGTPAAEAFYRLHGPAIFHRVTEAASLPPPDWARVRDGVLDVPWLAPQYRMGELTALGGLPGNAVDRVVGRTSHAQRPSETVQQMVDNYHHGLPTSLDAVTDLESRMGVTTEQHVETGAAVVEADGTLTEVPLELFRWAVNRSHGLRVFQNYAGEAARNLGRDERELRSFVQDILNDVNASPEGKAQHLYNWIHDAGFPMINTPAWHALRDVLTRRDGNREVNTAFEEAFGLDIVGVLYQRIENSSLGDDRKDALNLALQRDPWLGQYFEPEPELEDIDLIPDDYDPYGGLPPASPDVHSRSPEGDLDAARIKIYMDGQGKGANAEEIKKLVDEVLHKPGGPSENEKQALIEWLTGAKIKNMRNLLPMHQSPDLVRVLPWGVQDLIKTRWQYTGRISQRPAGVSKEQMLNAWYDLDPLTVLVRGHPTARFNTDKPSKAQDREARADQALAIAEWRGRMVAAYNEEIADNFVRALTGSLSGSLKEAIGMAVETARRQRRRGRRTP